MKNYISSGRVLTIPAPVGGTISGAPVVINDLIGIAHNTVAEGSPVAIAMVGVFTLPYTAGTAVERGKKLYWNTAAGKITTTASGSSLIGHAAEPVSATDAEIQVRLWG